MHNGFQLNLYRKLSFHWEIVFNRVSANVWKRVISVNFIWLCMHLNYCSSIIELFSKTASFLYLIMYNIVKDFDQIYNPANNAWTIPRPAAQVLSQPLRLEEKKLSRSRCCCCGWRRKKLRLVKVIGESCSSELILHVVQPLPQPLLHVRIPASGAAACHHSSRSRSSPQPHGGVWPYHVRWRMLID